MTVEDARELIQTLEKKICETVPDSTSVLSNETILDIFRFLPPTQLNVLPIVCKRFAEVYEMMELERFRFFLDKNQYAIRAAILLYMLEDDLFGYLVFHLHIAVLGNADIEDDQTRMDFEVVIGRQDGRYRIKWEETTTDSMRNLDNILEELGYKKKGTPYTEKEEIFRFLRNMLNPNHIQNHTYKDDEDRWHTNLLGFCMDNTRDTSTFFFRGYWEAGNPKERIQRFENLKPDHPIRALFYGYGGGHLVNVPSCLWFRHSEWSCYNFHDSPVKSLRIIMEMVKKALPGVKLW
jgi:hypothetical protein